ncbi:hypothetical protein ACKWOP_16340 [Escherichia coli]|uniref:hypothetical protein n=1 Tax=Escherichia coli TaxID=562 RepID=UPI00138851DE|nr:hypothetical protein [Salmonella enterica subsp. enterica serovar Dublin]
MKKLDLLKIDYLVGGVIFIGYAHKRKGPGKSRTRGFRIVKRNHNINPLIMGLGRLTFLISKRVPSLVKFGE